MPPMVSGSLPSLDYAMGGVMRGSMSRGNDHSPLVFVAIAGVHYATGRAVDGQQVDNDTLEIQETEGETPNTCSFQVRGFQPTDGQDVVITLGSKNNLDRWFAGTVLADAHFYTGTPANGKDAVNVIDHTWQLTRETITQRWTNVSTTVIAKAIIAHAGRGFTSLSVAAGLPILDEFTVTNQTHAKALSNLAARIGGYWKATYRSTVVGARADVRFGLTTDTSQTDPTTLTAASALLTEMNALRVTRDLSQVVTRQPVEGGGSSALAEIAPGGTLLPMADVSWFNPLGGWVVSGPQRCSYSGVFTGGAAALVGTNLTPSNGPTVAGAVGTGIDVGDHRYKVVFLAGAGHTLPSPPSAVFTSGSSIPAPGAPYAIPRTNGNLSAGGYLWKVSVVDINGNETLCGPQGPNQGAVTLGGALPSPPAGFTVGNNDSSGSLAAGGIYGWKVAFTTALGKTIPGPAVFWTISAGQHSAFLQSVPISADPNVTSRTIYRTSNGGSDYKIVGSIADNFTTQFVDGISDASRGAAELTVATALYLSALVDLPVSPDTVNVAKRRLYRTVANGSVFKKVVDINNNTTPQYLDDSIADGSLGATEPSVSTALYQRAALSNIPNGPATTTAREVYRDFNGNGVFKLLTTIANNTTTVFPDSTANASLGATAPTSDTSGLATATGEVAAGAASILVTSTAPFRSAGGWTFIGGLPVFYTGLTSTELTGVPPTGLGSLPGTIRYGTPITAPPMLTGIPASGTGAILYTIHPGDDVNLRVVIEDVLAQAVIAAMMTGTDDGVIEGTVIQDGRIGEMEARARGTAQIALRKQIDVSGAYTTKDKNTHAMRTIGVNLAAPTSCVGSFRLQQVQISGFAPARWPTCTARFGASVTLEDLLRTARGA